jgi:hypothetical protein
MQQTESGVLYFDGLDEFAFSVTPELGKSRKEREERIIYLKAATEDLDLEEEITKSSAISESLPYFLEDGKLTYEHITKENRHDPSLLIGEPIEARISPSGEFFCKGRLYNNPKLEKAEAVWQLLLAKAKLKASVGGFIKDRSRTFVKAIGREIDHITKLVLTHIAVTPFPVNQATQVQVVPFGEFAKSLFLGAPDEQEALAKELVAGSGTDVAKLTGGRALTVSPLSEEMIDTAFCADLFKDFLREVDIESLDTDRKALIRRFRERGATKREARELARQVSRTRGRIEELIGRKVARV